MNQIKTYQSILILLAGLLPAVGAGLEAAWPLLAWWGGWTAVWLLLLWGESGVKTAEYIPDGYANYLLAAGCFLLAYGAWLTVAAGWLLGGMLTTLAAWDLDAFGRRLQRVARIEQADQLIHTHLRQLALTLMLGLVVSLVALFVRYELRFGWGLLIIFLLIIAFAQVFRLLRMDTWTVSGGQRPNK
jgi:hypothetical protein